MCSLVGNGVNMSLEEACDLYLKKVAPGRIVCTLCGKESPAITNAKYHLEAKHFPTEGYSCEICQKFCKTRHGLSCHMSKHHRNVMSEFL